MHFFTPGWLVAAMLFLWGFFIFLGLNSCSFLGLLLMGFGVLAAVYQLLSCLSRRNPATAKWLRRILTVCVITVLLLAGITGVFIYQASLGAPETPCDYILVLGAGVNGTTPSLSLQDRIDAAYTYLVTHPDCMAIVSGGKGSGEDISEAQCMYNALTHMGIAAHRILMEDQATSTFENLAFSLELIEAETGAAPASLGIVSSDYHLFRAGLMARQQGIAAVGIPAPTRWVHLRVNYFLREIAGVWFYFLFGG